MTPPIPPAASLPWLPRLNLPSNLAVALLVFAVAACAKPTDNLTASSTDPKVEPAPLPEPTAPQPDPEPDRPRSEEEPTGQGCASYGTPCECPDGETRCAPHSNGICPCPGVTPGGPFVEPATPTPTPTPRPTFLCASDLECVVSCAVWQGCCPHPCHCSNVYHQDELAAVEAAQRAACTASAAACPQADCGQRSYEVKAVCVDGACQAKRSPT